MTDQFADVSGRTIVLTGASRGIGAVLLSALVRAGARVEVLGRDSPAFASLVRSLGADASRVRLHEADMADAAGLDRALQALARDVPVIDALVANAGVIGPMRPVVEIAPAELAEVFQVNVHAVHQLLHALDAGLQRAQAPRVIAMSSGAVLKTSPLRTSYCSSKLALECMVNIYANEHAGGAMCVNILRPGPTRTEMRASAYPQEDPMTLKPPEALLPLFAWLLSSGCEAHGTTIDGDAWLRERQ